MRCRNCTTIAIKKRYYIIWHLSGTNECKGIFFKYKAFCIWCKMWFENIVYLLYNTFALHSQKRVDMLKPQFDSFGLSTKLTFSIFHMTTIVCMKKGYIRCENRLKCADVTSDRAQQADGAARKEVGWHNTSTTRMWW